MSKDKQNFHWLNSRPDSAKNLINRAKKEVPGFDEHIRKFEHQIAIKSYSASTVFSYSRGQAEFLREEVDLFLL